MNTESLKILSEADRKAGEEVKKARVKRDQMIQESEKKAKEYELQLIEKKCQEVAQFREDTSAELVELEKRTEQRMADTLREIEEKEEIYMKVAKEIAKMVTK